MKLRQIVRDQKLINFDLYSLIKEKSSPSSSYEEFLDKLPKITRKGKKGQGSGEVSIRTALGYKATGFKDRAGNPSPGQEEAYREAIAQLQQGIEAKEIKRGDLGDDVKDDVERKSPARAPEEQPTTEPEEPEVTQADDDSDITTDITKGMETPDLKRGEEEMQRQMATEFPD